MTDCYHLFKIGFSMRLRRELSSLTTGYYPQEKLFQQTLPNFQGKSTWISRRSLPDMVLFDWQKVWKSYPTKLKSPKFTSGWAPSFFCVRLTWSSSGTYPNKKTILGKMVKHNEYRPINLTSDCFFWSSSDGEIRGTVLCPRTFVNSHLGITEQMFEDNIL